MKPTLHEPHPVEKRALMNITTILHLAARDGHANLIPALMQMPNIEVNIRNSVGGTALLIAAQHGHAPVVALLLEHKDIQVNLPTKEGATALCLAAESGHDAVVDLLLKHKGIQVNLPTMGGETALHIAAQNGHAGVVALLLDHEDIQVNLPNKKGATALYCAAYNGHAAVVALLLDHKDIQVNFLTKECPPALPIAVLNGHVGVVALLLDHEDIQLPKDGTTVLLQIAACNGHAALVALLLEHKNDIQVNLLAKNGTTALIMAAENGHAGVVDLLLKHKDIQVNALSETGVTALNRAAEKGHFEICTMLLISGGRMKKVADPRKVRLLIVLYALFTVSSITEGQTNNYVKQFLHHYYDEPLVRNDPVLTAFFTSGHVYLRKKLKDWARELANISTTAKSVYTHKFIEIIGEKSKRTISDRGIFVQNYFEIPKKLCQEVIDAYSQLVETQQFLQNIKVMITEPQTGTTGTNSSTETKISLATALRLCAELLENTPDFYSAEAIIEHVISRGHTATAELVLAKNTAIGEEEIGWLIELAREYQQDYTVTWLKKKQIVLRAQAQLSIAASEADVGSSVQRKRRKMEVDGQSVEGSASSSFELGAAESASRTLFSDARNTDAFMEEDSHDVDQAQQRHPSSWKLSADYVKR